MKDIANGRSWLNMDGLFTIRTGKAYFHGTSVQHHAYDGRRSELVEPRSHSPVLRWIRNPLSLGRGGSNPSLGALQPLECATDFPRVRVLGRCNIHPLWPCARRFSDDGPSNIEGIVACRQLLDEIVAILWCDGAQSVLEPIASVSGLLESEAKPLLKVFQQALACENVTAASHC